MGYSNLSPPGMAARKLVAREATQALLKKVYKSASCYIQDLTAAKDKARELAAHEATQALPGNVYKSAACYIQELVAAKDRDPLDGDDVFAAIRADQGKGFPEQNVFAFSLCDIARPFRVLSQKRVFFVEEIVVFIAARYGRSRGPASNISRCRKPRARARTR